MPNIEFLKPFDATVGNRRLLDELKKDLGSKDFNDFRLIVAYAKAGPLHRLKAKLEKWKSDGNTTKAIFGIDQQGTSKEALELALSLCDEVYITQERGITFHPKIYIFSGVDKIRAFIGSNNLTVGGTETNFEAAVIVNATLPSDDALKAELDDLWDQLLPAQCVATRSLDQLLLDQLVAAGDVLDEAALRKNQSKTTKINKTSKPKSGLKLKPPSPLPKGSNPAIPASSAAQAAPAVGTVSTLSAGGLAIQIKPHHNGEIFLSKLAVNQNPAFFGFPFTSMTTPKKAGGTPYPQRLPDPVVNVQVYGEARALLLNLTAYDLNTVFYEPKKEIRVTASPLVGVVPDYSVLVMTPSQIAGVDYEMEVHTPQSPDYASWVTACNQEMPGGGQTPRKFGWF
jgi:HKD family nuclease